MRGKNHNASVARRNAVLEQDILDWKRQDRDQKRRISELTADIKLMPALRERVAVLEMQLELATCEELTTLNKTVGEQRDQIRSLEASYAHAQGVIFKLLKHIGPKSGGIAVLEEALRIIDGEDITINMDIHEAAARRIGPEGVRRLNKARRA